MKDLFMPHIEQVTHGREVYFGHFYDLSDDSMRRNLVMNGLDTGMSLPLEALKFIMIALEWKRR